MLLSQWEWFKLVSTSNYPATCYAKPLMNWQRSTSRWNELVLERRYSGPGKWDGGLWDFVLQVKTLVMDLFHYWQPFVLYQQLLKNVWCITCLSYQQDQLQQADVVSAAISGASSGHTIKRHKIAITIFCTSKPLYILLCSMHTVPTNLGKTRSKLSCTLKLLLL